MKKLIYSRFGLVFLLMIGVFSACKQSQPPPTDPFAVTEGDSLFYSYDFDVQEFEDKPDWVNEKGPYRPAPTIEFDLLHTRLELEPNWVLEQMEGHATLTVSPRFYPKDTVRFDAKGMDIHRVAYIYAGDTTRLDYRYDSLKLHIGLGRSYLKEENISIFIKYTAKPNNLPEGGSDAISGEKGLYFVNTKESNPYWARQLWTQGETESNSVWFPTFDQPNIKTTQEVLVTIDSSLISLSNGRLVAQHQLPNGRRTDHWQMDKPHAPYLAALVVGDFVKVSGGKWNGVPLNYYVEQAYATSAAKIFEQTPAMLTFFSEKLDYPYPWPKYDQVVVRDFVSGAMENTTLSIFYDYLLSDVRALQDEHHEEIIAHELFHHWFGDLVTPESWAHLPLNESFATYAEYLWLEHKYGKAEAELHRYDEWQSYLYEARSKREPLIRYYYQHREDMFDAHSYAKGSLVLHLLRQYIGEEAFFAAMSHYIKGNAFQTAEISDFRKSVEAITGQDWAWFFEQWFMHPGHPELRVKEYYDIPGMLTLKVWQLQDTKYGALYRMPLTVEVWVNGEKQHHFIEVSKAEESFDLPVIGRPDLVLVNPGMDLPAEIDHLKFTEAFIYQYYHAEGQQARFDALQELSTGLEEPAILKTFLDALNDPFWGNREFVASAFEDYAEEETTLVAEALSTLALQDPHPMVRASALYSLATVKKDLATVEKALVDSSFAVVATALYAYQEMEGPNALARHEAYQNVDNPSVTMVVADFFAYEGASGKLEWFKERILKANSGSRNTMINYLSAYLLNNEEERAEGLAFLMQLLNTSGNPYTRMACVQGLLIYEQEKGVKESLLKAKEKEKHPMMIEYFESSGM